MAKKAEGSGIMLTEIEINMVNTLNQRKTQLTEEVNNIAQQKIVLDYRYKQAEKRYEEVVTLEGQIVSALVQKYGNGTVDIERGMFNPSQSLG
jgi:Trm5-related predicted tRNA methylase